MFLCNRCVSYRIADWSQPDLTRYKWLFIIRGSAWVKVLHEKLKKTKKTTKTLKKSYFWNEYSARTLRERGRNNNLLLGCYNGAGYSVMVHNTKITVLRLELNIVCCCDPGWPQSVSPINFISEQQDEGARQNTAELQGCLWPGTWQTAVWEGRRFVDGRIGERGGGILRLCVRHLYTYSTSCNCRAAKNSC